MCGTAVPALSVRQAPSCLEVIVIRAYWLSIPAQSVLQTVRLATTVSKVLSSMRTLATLANTQSRTAECVLLTGHYAVTAMTASSLVKTNACLAMSS